MWFLPGQSAREGEEDVIEVGRADRQRFDLDRIVEFVQQRTQGCGATVARHLQGQGLVVPRGLVESIGRQLERGPIGELQQDVPAGDPSLQLGRRTDGHDAVLVEHRDPIGELVGLVQVLRGEEDGDSVGDQAAHDLPHHVTTARVEAGRRLVEEDDPRIADQCHGEIESSAHAARVGRRRLFRRVDELEALQQFGNSAPALIAPEVSQLGHQRQVLPAGEQVVDGRELTGHPDHRAHAVRVAGEVEPADECVAPVGLDQGRQDLHHRRLSCAVGAEEGEDRAFGNVQVDIVEDDLVAVRLPDAGRGDCECSAGGDGCGHRGPLTWFRRMRRQTPGG